jgi:hypothetical protein
MTCRVSDCRGRHYGKGYCQKHYLRHWRGQNVEGRTRRPQGTGSITTKGYLVVRIEGRTVRQHRLVMEQTLGRPLLESETVHHKNGIRNDNRPDNLELRVSHHGQGQSVPDLIAFAREILSRYGEEFSLIDTQGGCT